MSLADSRRAGPLTDERRPPLLLVVRTGRAWLLPPFRKQSGMTANQQSAVRAILPRPQIAVATGDGVWWVDVATGATTQISPNAEWLSIMINTRYAVPLSGDGKPPHFRM